MCEECSRVEVDSNDSIGMHHAIRTLSFIVSYVADLLGGTSSGVVASRQMNFGL